MLVDDFNADLAAWVIVACYAIAFGLILLARRGATAETEQLFWALAAIAIFALGLNKQLDLQTQLTEFGRQIARDGGWFQYRREVQAMFVKGLAVGLGVATLLLGFLVRHMEAPVKLVLLGLLMLGGFVLLRAASFHHVDRLLRTQVFGTRAWVVIELAGILVVGIGAVWSILRARPPAVLSKG